MTKILRITCLALLLLALGPAMPAQGQTILCRSTSFLRQATSIGQATACFTLSPAPGSTALRLDLAVTSGTYDLYVKAGSTTSLAATDKVNVSAVSGGLSYVHISPGAGPYTVAVVATGRSGAARLLPVAYQATLKCTSTACTATYPLTSMPGPKFGDQAIFSVAISKAGRVEMNVSWRGTARLSALLYGPTVSKTGIAQSPLARKDGASPLAVTYDVRSTNLIRGGKWSVGLNNAGRAGGTITGGTLSITYPR